LYWRNGVNNAWNTWKKILDTSNTTYTASVTSGTSAAYQIGTLKIGDTETTIYGKNTTYTSLKNPYPIQIQANSTVLGTYDGSATTTVNITAANLGLSTVFDYKGITTTTLTDGSTSQTIKIDNRDYKAKTGDVVIVNGDTDKEYFWNGTKWEELGRTIDLSGYELIGHTHDYLPLSGGTMTGPITFNLTDADKNVIRINNGTYTDSTIGQYGYTLKYLGSGSGDNNSLALFSDNCAASTQNKAIEIKQSGDIHTRNIIPLANNTHSLGSSNYKWSNVYATTFTGNLTGNVTGHLSGTISMTSGDANVYRNILVTNGSNGICYSAAGNVLLNYATGDVKATSFTGNLKGNVTGTADIAKTLPHFKISSNGTLPSDGSPEYVKFATITIPTTAWARKSVTLIFQDYEGK
jgi:hypothetical protein